jgi:hypothetical protein
MSVLRNFESKIAGLVEGTFGRVFRSEVRPVRARARPGQGDGPAPTVSISRVYVPNEYVVWLSPDGPLAASSGRRARRSPTSSGPTSSSTPGGRSSPRQPAAGRPFETDEALKLGEFGIQAQMVRTSKVDARMSRAGDHGSRWLHDAPTACAPISTSPQGAASADGARDAPRRGQRMVVPSVVAVVGRSRDADIVLAEPNVSRRHAEIRPAGRGRWVVSDLGSTNGVKVNGRLADGDAPLEGGDRIALGTAEIRFVVE